jgi:hypothetical protein
VALRDSLYSDGTGSHATRYRFHSVAVRQRLIVGTLGPADPARSQTSAGTWTQKTPMPAVRGAAVAVGSPIS